MATVTLDELIRSVQQDAPTPLEQLSSASETAAALGELGDSLLNHFVDRCRRSGHTWAEIGEHLGVTRQAAQKRFVEESRPEPSMERYTDRARLLILRARQIAHDELHHTYVGTEHLLLACFDIEGNLGLALLQHLGISREAVLAQITEQAPTGTGNADLMPFTPQGRKAFSEATEAAVELGHNYVGCEHLLLGIWRVEKGLGGQVLRDLGVTQEALVSRTIELLAGYTTPATEAPAKKAPAEKTPAKKAAPRKKA